MTNTTIAVTNEVKKDIMEFGLKGETYSNILKRLVESAKKRILQDLLMDETNTVTIEEAIDRAKKRWPR